MKRIAIALAAAALSCAARPNLSNNQSSAASTTATLQSTSTIACTTDGECGVCYRAQSCGEPIAANDPAVDTPECHVTPAPFCMPRRGRCEERRCVAR